MPEFTLTGIKAIDRALKTLEPRVAKKVIRQSIRKNLKPMKSRTQDLAPVGETGVLHTKIKLRAMRRKRNRIGLLISTGAADFQGDTFYGAMVDLGTKHQEAQRFFERAFAETEDAALAGCIRDIRAGIEREARSR